MILADIKDYMKAQKQASLKDIAVHFDVPESALKEMIAHWERKGKLQKLPVAEDAACQCGSVCGQKCASCSTQCNLIYQWKED